MENRDGLLVDPSRPANESTIEIPWQPARGPWVVELGSPDSGQSLVLELGRGLALGSGDGVDVRIEDRSVSARHCTLTATVRGLRVIDHRSTNGLFLGTARVSEAMLPSAGGSFVIGRTAVTVRAEHRADSLPPGRELPGVVGSSACMRAIAWDVRRYAGLQAPVLIQGESGTGKDLIAHALHTLGGRSGPFVTLNVGAIPESLADAELFGHRRGAFTGAVTSHAGAFEQADRGTLFLDEIAELSSHVQVKLLRVVEDGRVRPIGGAQAVEVNVRIVSATWAVLAERVRQGQFRPDLFHRLSTVVIELPPLRERRSDIPALSRALLARYEHELGAKRLTPSALARLVAYSWPGNVRELGSVLYRAAARSPTVDIRSEHIELAPPGRRTPSLAPLAPADAVRLLECHDGNVSAAARAARVPRSTFRGWLDRARDG